MDYSKQELEQMLEREKLARLICAEFNTFEELKPTFEKVIAYTKRLAKCEAVSIRLYEDGDYPYYVYLGFPELFIRKDSHICRLDENGNRIPSSEGDGYVLECMCGKVLSGKFDPFLSSFTEYGSFWSDYMSALLLSARKDKQLENIRNDCNACGYESIALIPIKVKGKRIGLIQLNDSKLGVFDKELVEYLETIAEQIGLTIYNSLTYNKRTTTDALTNTFNRRGLINAISVLAPLSTRNKQNIATILIDIDHFKQVNESYGYKTGDHLLRIVADIIKGSVRGSDIVGRYNREEFLVFLSAVEPTALPSIAEKLRHKIEEQTKDSVPITVSIGAAEGILETGQKTELFSLIRKANESLAQAKSSGRNRVFIGG